MGLDITAYEYAKITDPITTPRGEPDWDALYDNNIVVVTLNSPDFTRSYRGLEIGKYYQTSGNTIDFRAGSYGGYNYFRNQLSISMLHVEAQAVWDDSKNYKDKPFFELINFSDCEGYIGPEACADLAQDFEESMDVLKTELTDSFWRDEKYLETWLNAFKLASNTGLVEFH